MDTTKKFDGRARDYTVSRPTYSLELINYLYQYYFTNDSIIADIASGTGKFTKQLLERGSHVYGVEPNDEIRHIAEEELYQYEKFHSIAGQAENTTLQENFVDYITVAQAFHWFDVQDFKKECLRIMKKGGKVFLIWNIRSVHSPFNKAWHEIYEKYCPEFQRFSNGIKRDDQRIRDFFNNEYESIAFENPLYFDGEKFISRCLSSSYSLKEGDVGYENYIKELNVLFQQFSNDGVVMVENQTVVYIGEV